jgi:hypothetical protein
MEQMFHSDIRAVPGPVPVERIPRAIDSWDRPSRMPRRLVWLIAYLTGFWGCPFPGEPPRGARDPELWAAEFPSPTAWRECLDDVIDVDRHAALKGGLLGWLASGYSVGDGPPDELGVPPNELLLSQLKRIWPTLDGMPPFVAFHLAYALFAWAGEKSIREAATRLAERWHIPEDAFGSDEDNARLVPWLRAVAIADPVLTLKIGAEAMLRFVVANETQLRAQEIAG